MQNKKPEVFVIEPTQHQDRHRATRLLTDALDEVGYALRTPGEFPITRAVAQRIEESITRAIKLLTKISD